MAEAAVRARDLWFTYKPSGFHAGKAQPSLRGVSLEIRRGEVYGLLGPNGAGKTTLIKLLSTLLLPDKGDLTVFGEPLPGGEEAVRRRLGVGLAEYERTFHFRLTGRQNLRFFAAFLDLPRREVGPRIDETLAQVGLSEAADRMFFEYSSGMKHRLAVARALLPRPDLLILDEPTAGLDAQTSRALGDLVLRLAREEEATVVYTTHRMEEAGRLCDRVGILNRGLLVAEETPAALQRLAGSTLVLRARLDRADQALADACAALPGVKRVFLDGSSALRLHVDEVDATVDAVLGLVRAHGRRVLSFNTGEPSLEDAFLALTREVETPVRPA